MGWQQLLLLQPERQMPELRRRWFRGDIQCALQQLSGLIPRTPAKLRQGFPTTPSSFAKSFTSAPDYDRCVEVLDYSSQVDLTRWHPFFVQAFDALKTLRFLKIQCVRHCTGLS